MARSCAGWLRLYDFDWFKRFSQAILEKIAMSGFDPSILDDLGKPALSRTIICDTITKKSTGQIGLMKQGILFHVAHTSEH
jgi:hypothetical protein